jgi:hypothetical protein
LLRDASEVLLELVFERELCLALLTRLIIPLDRATTRFYISHDLGEPRVAVGIVLRCVIERNRGAPCRHDGSHPRHRASVRHQRTLD